MKFNLKGIGKAIIAAGTMVGGSILAIQAKKSLKGEEEFEPTLEPLGDIEIEEEEQEQEPEEDQEEATE